MHAQLGYSVDDSGESLVGTEPGDWQADWVVVGHETACGDPIFSSHSELHPVFTAMHGEGTWEPMVVAPSLESFRDCLRVFRQFAQGRSSPVELEDNPPSESEQAEFIRRIRELTTGEEEAWMFWAVQIDIDLEAYRD